MRPADVPFRSANTGRGLNLHDIPKGPDFITDGLCAQTDPAIFHPEKGGSTKEAKRVCRECPVRAECLTWALETDQRFGVWGGMSGYERRSERRRRGLGAA